MQTTYRTRHWTLKLHESMQLTALSRIWCAVCDRPGERGTVYQNVGVTEPSSAHVSVCLPCWATITTPEEPATMPTTITICANGVPMVTVNRAQFEDSARAARQQPATCLQCSFAAPQHAPGCVNEGRATCPDCDQYWCSGCTNLWPDPHDHATRDAAQRAEAEAELAAHGWPLVAGGSEDSAEQTAYCVRCKRTWQRPSDQYTDYCVPCRDVLVANTRRCNAYDAERR